MKKAKTLERITISPKVCNGKPNVAGCSVETVLHRLSSGLTIGAILQELPTLNEKDVLACILFAKELVSLKYQDYKYHATDLHRRLLFNLLLNIKILHNDRNIDISEYDIQAIVALFLTKCFINTNYHVFREKSGKSDCVISRVGKEDNPEVLYELKTCLKPKESLSTSKMATEIVADIFKLFTGLNKYPGARGYFILVTKMEEIIRNPRKKYSKNKNPIHPDILFVKNHFENNKNLEFFKNEKGEQCKIRPSGKEGVVRFNFPPNTTHKKEKKKPEKVDFRKDDVGEVVVLSWEVLRDL